MSEELHTAADALAGAARDFARIAALAALIGLLMLALMTGVFLTSSALPSVQSPARQGPAPKPGPKLYMERLLG